MPQPTLLHMRYAQILLIKYDVSPIIWCLDMEKAVNFYCKSLGAIGNVPIHRPIKHRTN